MVDVPAAFGKRLVDPPGKGYFIDERPLSLDELMRLYNRRRKAAGLPQIVTNAAWISNLPFSRWARHLR
jgi:hypothetical protein